MARLLLLSLGISVDAAAAAAGVRTAGGLARVSVIFGGFHALMAGLGWWGGAWITAIAGPWDHWLAFGLLLAIGGRAALVAGRELAGGADMEPPAALDDLRTAVLVAFATSLDAIAVGPSLALLGPGPGVALPVLGAVTAVCCLLAGALARRAGDRFGAPVRLLGGLVLIAIGVDIAIAHTRAGI